MSHSIQEVCSKLRILLEGSVKRNQSEGILLSGGLDTSALALIASKYTPPKAFTVGFEGAPAPDVEYAALVAGELQLEHTVRYFGEDELYDAIREVVRIVKSFDPMEIRNSVAIYVALKAIKERGMGTVMTGDGCDELFAGYGFLLDLEEERMDLELRKLWAEMRFSSIPLAKALGLEAKLPYLDPDLKSFAMGLDSGYKIRGERGRRWGKWIVRKAFEGALPERIVWREKTPIEDGSGTAILSRLFDRKISDGVFEEKKRELLERDCVLIRDKEQLFYYEVYRSAIGIPHLTDPKGKACPQCHSSVAEKAAYCRTCGAHPI